MAAETKDVVATLNDQVLMLPDKRLLYTWLVAQLGTEYRWGGQSPLTGWDCSGLVVEMLKAFGRVPEAWDSTALGLYGHLHKYVVLNPGLGCLCFFGRKLSEITHVGIALNNWQMVEAGGGGPTTVSRADAEKQRAYVRIRPINNRDDYLISVQPWSHTF